MNRIVREHYPAARLPEDLQDELGGAATVRLVIEADIARPAHTRQQAVRELLELRERLQPSTNDSVERVSALRDEWDIRP